VNKEGAEVTSTGRAFQTRTPATEKARRPTVGSLTAGTHRSFEVDVNTVTKMTLTFRYTLLDIDGLTFTADKRLFGHISSKTHCLHNLLPPQRSVRTASSLRTRGHNFTLPHTDFNPYKNSFINRCLFQFL